MRANSSLALAQSMIRSANSTSRPALGASFSSAASCFAVSAPNFRRTWRNTSPAGLASHVAACPRSRRPVAPAATGADCSPLRPCSDSRRPAPSRAGCAPACASPAPTSTRTGRRSRPTPSLCFEVNCARKRQHGAPATSPLPATARAPATSATPCGRRALPPRGHPPVAGVRVCAGTLGAATRQPHEP